MIFVCRPDAEFLERLTSVQRQKEHHRAELARWQQAVRSAAQLVRESEAALSQLQVCRYTTTARSRDTGVDAFFFSVDGNENLRCYELLFRKLSG